MAARQIDWGQVAGGLVFGAKGPGLSFGVGGPWKFESSVSFSFLQTTVVNKSQAVVCKPCMIMPPGELLKYTKPRCHPD